MSNRSSACCATASDACGTFPVLSCGLAVGSVWLWTLRGARMVVPVAVRSLAAVAGGALVIAAWASAVGTLVVPRRGSRLTRWTDRIVDRAFIVAAGAGPDYRRRGRVLVAQGATILIVQFAAWLGGSFIGFTLLLWPFVTGGITQAFAVAGGAMTTLGFSEPADTIPPAI